MQIIDLQPEAVEIMQQLADLLVTELNTSSTRNNLWQPAAAKYDS